MAAVTRRCTRAAVQALKEACVHARSLSTAPAVATSLAEAFSKRDTAEELRLPGHPDIRCVNLMCAKVGRGCACRVALSLSRMPRLRMVDLSANALPDLPDSLAQLPALEELHLQDNELTGLAVLARAAPGALSRLRVLDLRRNKIGRLWKPGASPGPASALHGDEGLPLAALEALDSLQEVRLEGNPILKHGPSVSALQSSLLDVRGVFKDLPFGQC